MILAMRIYFLGAHSSGKTTLSRYVSKKYDLPMITEVARTVLARMEVSLDSLRTDLDLVNEYQQSIFQEQVRAEKLLQDNFVSDRAFDNLCYAAEHTNIFADIIESSEYKEYLKWVAGGIVFFVRPHESLLKADGVRERLNWEGVVRIDGMVKLLLEQSRIPYVSIHPHLMQERCRLVDYVIDLHQQNTPRQ